MNTKKILEKFKIETNNTRIPPKNGKFQGRIIFIRRLNEFLRN